MKHQEHPRHIAPLPADSPPEKKPGFYGRFARFGRWLLRGTSPCYAPCVARRSEPVVYVCRHLNMHGPLVTLKWLPFAVHPMVLHVFFDRKKTEKHLREYTFSSRFGRKTRKFSLAAWVMGWVSPPMMRSLQAIAVYRDGIQSLSTLKNGLNFLLRGESIIVYPDVEYTGGYDTVSEIYDGFLLLGDMFYKKTGKALPFVPLVIDDENRQITEAEAVCVSCFRREGAQAAQRLKQAMNPGNVLQQARQEIQA